MRLRNGGRTILVVRDALLVGGVNITAANGQAGLSGTEFRAEDTDLEGVGHLDVRADDGERESESGDERKHTAILPRGQGTRDTVSPRAAAYQKRNARL